MIDSTIYGVVIDSRYEDAGEIAQMHRFLKLLHEEYPSLCELIKSLFYDSNSSYCTFKFNSLPDYESEEMRNIFHVARRSLVQFEWDNGMEHFEGPESK